MGPDGNHATLAELCLRAAREHGDAAAVDDGDHGLSYTDLGRHARRAAGALIAAGVRPGDRVLISASNSSEWVTAAFGVALAGATIVPVNDRLTVAEQRRAVDSLHPVAVLTDGSVEHSGAWADLRVFAMDELRGWAGTADVLPETGPHMTALVMQTSGTTGDAKAVPMNHGPLLELYTDLSRRIGLRSTDVLLGPVPLAHGFGLFGVLLDGLLAGACVRLVQNYDRDGIADLLVDEGVTALFAPPTVFHDVARSGRADIGHRCRIALTGGAEVALPWFHATCDALDVPRRLVGYGMTEAYGAIAFADVSDQRSGALPALTPLPGVDVRIGGGPGAVAGGGVGEVLVRGASVVGGAQGWLATGDVGRLDDDGRLTVMSRMRDSVIVSGFNVSPMEVEDALRQQPGVADAVVVGLPDERQGERVVGCVVMTEDAWFDAEALDAACRSVLAPYKVPSELVELADLPSTRTGKRSRTAVREQLLSRQPLNPLPCDPTPTAHSDAAGPPSRTRPPRASQ